MKILKFVLWLILLFCLLWVGAIFLGPAVITNTTSYFSDGRINLQRVKVSPKLKISAAVIDYTLTQGFGTKNLEIVSRALSIDWSIEDGFQLIGKIGPSSIEGKGTLLSLDFTLTPLSVFDWRESHIQLDFVQLDGSEFQLERGSFDGKFSDSFRRIKNLEFVVPKISGEFYGNFFEAKALKFNVDHYALATPVNRQNLELTFRLKQIELPDSAFKSSSLGGDIRLSDGQATLTALVSGAQLGRPRLTAKSLSVSTRQLSLSSAVKGAWDFSVSDIELKDPDINIENYSGNLTIMPSLISHTGRAVISKLVLKNDQYFIGQIENAVLNIDFSSRSLPSKIHATGQAELSFPGSGDLSAGASIDTTLSEFDISGCFSQRCDIQELEAEYFITVSDTTLLGNLKCEKRGCFERPTSHQLKIDNTNRFFQELSKFNILSPISLPIAFMVVSRGKVLGDGHVLNF